ncbi:MAG: 30S ribosomal protein S16 [Chlamydiota bacterium]
MALKIRLRRQGRSNRPFYRIVVADIRERRDGKYIEAIGWYNPIEKDEAKTLYIDNDRASHWLKAGAQPTEKAWHLLSNGAPEVVKEHHEQKQARKVAQAAKRREARHTEQK